MPLCPPQHRPGHVLLVRHGRGRGRLYKYKQDFIRYVESQRPDVWCRLRLHFTGEPPPSLDCVRAVVFWVADPLRELYPDEYAECAWIADRARQRSIPVINDPDALSNSVRGRQAHRLAAAGIPTPPMYCFADRAGFECVVQKVEFPALVRAELLHSQEGLHLCWTREEALSLSSEAVQMPGAVSPLIDTRKGYLERDPESVWAHYYHKKRALVLGDTVVPLHVFFADTPVVAWDACLFGNRYPRPNVLRRLLGPRGDVKATIDAERPYLQGRTEEDALLLVAAVRALDLQFGALDYSTFADGRHVVWEVNPYPYLGSMGRPSPYREVRRSEEKRQAYFEAFSDWFQRLSEGLSDGDRPRILPSLRRP